MWPTFPQGEHETVRLASNQLSSLASLVRRFADALALVDFCEAQIAQAQATKKDTVDRQAAGAHTGFEATQAFREAIGYPLAWISMAARDAIITIWDFAETLHGLRSAIRRSPTLAAYISDEALDASISWFHTEFPDAKSMRHAAAHNADTVNRPNQHSFTGSVELPGVQMENSKNIIISAISGRTVIVTREGKVMQYDITEGTLQKLYGLQQQIYRNVLPAAEAIEKRALEQFVQSQLKKNTPSDG